MQVENMSWAVQADTLEELASEAWPDYYQVCFHFLKNNHKRFLKVRLRNLLDASFFDGMSTQEWFELWMPDIGNKVLSWKVCKKYFYITLDLHQMSYEWILSILTLLRYPGEAWNICYNFWRLKQETPTMDNWKLLQIAHKVYLTDWPQEIASCLYYNSGHALFTTGEQSPLCLKEVFKKLDSFRNFPQAGLNSIQNIWGTSAYGPIVRLSPQHYKEKYNEQ